MNIDEVSIQTLEGPYSHHVYIGFSPADLKSVKALEKKLSERGVICCDRAMNDGIQKSIQEGVASSQKCLLFLTSDYLKDKWYTMETTAMIEKSQRFSRDVVITLTSKDLKVIPERLMEFKAEQFKPEKLNDEKFLAQFVDLIIREPNVHLAVLPKQNIGYGAAFSYFYGYLRLVLPDFKKRLLEETLGKEPGLVPKTVQKMLIIMPETCFCAVELKSPGQIEFTGKFVVRIANRAGNEKRDYKSSLFRLIDHERKDEYYFVGELATPLLTMYETHHFGLCGMTQDQLYVERDAFYFTLKAILSHPDNAECNDQFRLLYWSDPGPDKRNKLDLYNFLLPELRKEIMLQRQNERNPSKMGTINTVRLLPLNRPSLNSFETVKTSGSNPASIYEESFISKYPMEHRPRGMCLIVNIASFDKGQTHLKSRKGAEKDGELLPKLFKDLHFEVQVHNDVNEQTLESLFLTMHITDHTNYDAFVCCILTHGKLGVIYTSDGKEVEILKLVDFFTDKNCPSLKGKPKMFFIQACQRGEPVQENRAGGSSLPHDDAGEVGVALPSSPTIQSDSAANVASQDGDGSSNITGVEGVIEEDATSAPTVSTLDGSLPTNFKHKAVLVPGSPDFLMSYSTLPGSISYRDTIMGSLYVQALDRSLRSGLEMDRALKMVSAHVKENLRERGQRDGVGQPDGTVQEKFQLPFHLTSGMDRLIYL